MPIAMLARGFEGPPRNGFRDTAAMAIMLRANRGHTGIGTTACTPSKPTKTRNGRM
jgi:hypothetical protein